MAVATSRTLAAVGVVVAQVPVVVAAGVAARAPHGRLAATPAGLRPVHRVRAPLTLPVPQRARRVAVTRCKWRLTNITCFITVD